VRRDPLRFRAAWVVLAAVGFWVLAVGLVSLLVWGGFAIVAYAPDHVVAGVAAWGLALALAYGVLPRGSSEKEDPSPPVGPAEHPRLRAFVLDVAAKAGARPPDAVYVFHEANAFAGRRRGRLLAKRESVVGIGLPLLAVLTESESRAVLAHEMGHHVGGDVALGPWVHRTRRAIARAVERLEGSSFWLHLPFVAYAELFLRASARISRAQELAADALAATVAGPAATASALRKVDVIASAWGTFFHSEVVPLLAKGRLPPLLDGWHRYWSAAQTPDTPAFESLESVLKASHFVAEGDTHPPLGERIAALGDPAPVSDGAPPALALLDDVARAEERVLRDLLEAGAKLEPIAWDVIAEEVWLPAWREVIEPHKHALARFDVRSLPGALAQWEPIAGATRRGPAVASPEAERRRVVHLVAKWFIVGLADRGWRVEAPPGLAVRATRDGRSLEPFALVASQADAPDAALWARVCAEHGLA
jgi:Zn-dependent protease with chaperone function